MKLSKKILSLLLCTIMVLGTIAISGDGFAEVLDAFSVKASAASYSDGTGSNDGWADSTHIRFGSYPQTDVTASMGKTLDAKATGWKSYKYYSGTDEEFDGQMSSADYMMYCDVTVMNGPVPEKYRGVKFSTYRPWLTADASTTLDYDTYQDDNGYTYGKTYWFKYESLVWRVLDSSTGLVMCESIIDSQAYNNYIWYGVGSKSTSSEYYGNEAHTNYANDYYNSSIRKWLTEDFYDTAFSESQQNKLLKYNCDNSCYSSSYPEYDSQDSSDKVFLLSYDEVKNTAYGFNNNIARRAKGTDYAKCQGLDVCNYGSEYDGNSCWWLRSPHSDSSHAREVGDGGFSNCSYRVYCTDGGVRPALKLNLASFTSQSSIPDDAVIFIGHSYKLYPADTVNTWEEAKEYCESLGGHLATITSAEENKFLYQYITSKGIKSAYFGYRKTDSGDWEWVNDETSDYTNWSYGEPNGASEHGKEENCAEFFFKYDGFWNDGDFGNYNADDSNSFICEWDHVNYESKTFTMGRDNWAFNNVDSNFNPVLTLPKNQHYYLSKNAFETLKKLNNSDFEKVKNEAMGGWTGSCYGFSVTSLLAFYNFNSVPESIRKNYNTLYEIPNYHTYDELVSYINFYQLQQLLGVEDDYLIEYLTDIDGISDLPVGDEQTALMNKYALERIIDLCQKGISFELGIDNFPTGGAHAVIGYKLESGSFNKNGKNYNMKLYIYDSCHPDDLEISNIYFNEGGSEFFTNMPYNRITNVFENVTRLYTVDYDGNVSKEYKSSHNISYSGNSGKYTLSSNDKTYLIDGSFINVKDNLYAFIEATDTFEDDTTAKKNLHLIIPREDYSYTVIPSANDNSEFSLSTEKSLVSVKSSNAKSITFNSSGEIKANNISDYSFDLIFNEGYYNMPWYGTSISGSKANSIDAKMTDNGVLVKADNLNDIEIKVFDKEEERSVSVFTDEGALLISSKKVNGENIPIVLVDKNNDGNFETEISSNNVSKVKITSLKNITVDYKSSVTLHATADVADTKIAWFNADNSQKIKDGTEYKVSPATSTFKVYAAAVDESGKEIEGTKSETETVTVKTGLWQSILAFFRNLFGKLPIWVDNSKK